MNSIKEGGFQTLPYKALKLPTWEKCVTRAHLNLIHRQTWNRTMSKRPTSALRAMICSSTAIKRQALTKNVRVLGSGMPKHI